MDLLGTHWPWWLGAIALGSIAVGHWLLVGKLLGVSGAFQKIVRARAESRAAREEASFLDDPALLEAALVEATLAAMGSDAAAASLAEAGAAASSANQPDAACEIGSAPAGSEPAVRSRTPWTAHLCLLVGLVAGGTLSAALGGRLRIGFALDQTFAAIWGHGWAPLGVLLAGGALAGFGAGLCGGCTSGHGLSGCSRLQPGSLLATASFFGAAVLVSMALSRWLA
jgi:uncharacterized membrane protein YedE/YeeE